MSYNVPRTGPGTEQVLRKQGLLLLFLLLSSSQWGGGGSSCRPGRECLGRVTNGATATMPSVVAQWWQAGEGGEAGRGCGKLAGPLFRRA